MFSNSDGRFGVDFCLEHYFEDQLWSFVNSSNGDFMIKSKDSGKCLYNNADGRFNVFDCTRAYSDQWWKITGRVDYQYRIKNRNSKLTKIMYFIIYIFTCIIQKKLKNKKVNAFFKSRW